MLLDDSQINLKQLFRFTGPPEHWLATVKYMTWGLERKYESKWKNIQPGDIFIIHSTGPQTSYFKNAKSGIIGFGVVGPQFNIKDNFLWLYEHDKKENKWPLLIPLSEMYLFSELPDTLTWEAPNPENHTKTTKLIDQLLKNIIPLSHIKGFPQMGSFSSVKPFVVEQVLQEKRNFYPFYSGKHEDDILKDKHTPLIPINNSSESLRYADTLRVFSSIDKKVIGTDISVFKRDNEILSRAEEAHSSILQNLIELFKKRGYETFSNRMVDFFAHNDKRSFLVEVKSTENKNFRSQARKGIVQLFEYDYFEIDKYKKENDYSFSEEYKILVPSRKPKDNNYIDFINSLELGVATVEDESLKPIGNDFGFSNI